MKKADVVIGANLGDEGKGLVTDYLAAPYGEDALVVRFCGGAQAGHTVTTPDGKRHVFNHFGSGSFCGASTFLSRFFVCHPILFLAEIKRLQGHGIRPKVFLDPLAAVTTPYDMMINQMAEEARGSSRHGSCGVGFGETVERQQYPGYTLHFIDLYDRSKLKAKLEAIRSIWVPARLRRLKITSISKEWEDRIQSNGLLKRYMEDVEAFLDQVSPATLSLLDYSKHIIFEGAQGLLLDQDHSWFPHVTRSHTGLRNVVTLADAAGLDELNVHYASRSYATRHGAGPLPHELSEKPYSKIVDLTNVPNPHQGTLRFGWLDLDLLQKTICTDLGFAEDVIKVNTTLAISCVDQIDDQAKYIQNGTYHTASIDHFLAAARDIIPDAGLLASFGPTRATMRAVAAPSTQRRNEVGPAVFPVYFPSHASA